jgi:4-aminobutyrate aminotransferase-like enzyme
MRSSQVLKLLRAYESRNVTFVAPDGSWPIVWARAQGVHVWDAEGRRYLDLTAAFGVAAAGHASRSVVQAARRQSGQLLHAMGDVHPHALKARLARALSRLTFERWTRAPAGQIDPSRGSKGAAKTLFCNSGFEAVEAALKTALLATGKPGVLAFTGAYHGLGYGALNATHRDYFRSPFRSQLREFTHFVPFPCVARSGEKSSAEADPLAETLRDLRRVFRRHAIGAVLVEPVQGRGGIRVPPAQFLPSLRRLCDEQGALLILDEIYTGFGRTGRWFACEHARTAPDVICLGKALAGGFPLSACVGRAALMDAAWPASPGEALHTSTFSGHPVGCAMALANLRELERKKLVERSAARGAFLLDLLKSRLAGSRLQIVVRGLGLMVGVELRDRDGNPATPTGLRIVQAMLRRGFIVLPEGEHSEVISFTPPLTITKAQLSESVDALAEALNVP